MHVHIRLLGRFDVAVDGRPLPSGAWQRRSVAALVKLLVLQPGRRLRREQVIDALWPDLLLDEAAPRLHQAASYARAALGARDAVVLDHGTVTLLPTAEVTVDVAEFDRAADGARDRRGATAALDRYDGDLLPDDIYESWTEQPRARLRRRRLDLLRVAGRSQDVVPADPADAGRPAPESRRPMPRAALPAPRTRLVGRRVDLAAVDALLRSHRVVTITGPGGAGKTRLALAVARRRAGDPGTEQDVALAELAPVRDAAGVVRTVAEAAGVQGESAVALAGLAATLGARPLLLVLDNCEHLLDAAAEVVDAILDAGPVARILLTSREPLRVDGEAEHRIGSLGPAAGELFAERALAAAGSAPAADDPRMLELCRRLDGLPLAIELAAAQLRHLTLDELGDRLDERLTLLVGGRPAAGVRHSALTATVEWSYQLLSEPARRLLDRLGVFPAGFDLAAAQAVAGSADPSAITNLLGDLVAKSLVVHDARSRRYRLLETIRLFADQRLQAAGLRPEVEELLRRHVVARATELPRPRAWLSASLAAHGRDDLPTVRLAFRASLARGELTDAVDVALSLSTLWRSAVSYAEGDRWVAALLDRDLAPRDRLWALLLQADVALGSGDARLIRDASAAAQPLAADVDDIGAAVIAAIYRAMVRLTTPAEMVEQMLDTADRARAVGEPELAHIAQSFVVVARVLLGRTDGLDDEARRLVVPDSGTEYDRYLAIWAAWNVALAARDGRRLRELMDLQLVNLRTSGIGENWMTMFSQALTLIGEGADHLPQLRRARRRAEAEGRQAEADCVLALVYAAACSDEWERAAELLGAIGRALFRDTVSFVHHAVMQERVVRPRLAPAVFEAACARGEGRELTEILDAHGL